MDMDMQLTRLGRLLSRTRVESHRNYTPALGLMCLSVGSLLASYWQILIPFMT